MPHTVIIGPNVTSQQGAVIPSASENNDGVMTSAMVRQLNANSSEAATSDVAIYVNSVSGADNKDGKTPAKAVKTFAKALSLVPCCWNKSMKIIFAPGTYDDTGIGPTGGIFPGNPVGAKATPLVLVGAFTTVATGTVTVTDPNGAQVQSGVATSINSNRGQFLRFTSGANVGGEKMINENNGAGKFFLNYPYLDPFTTPIPISAGDTFVIEVPSVTINCNNPFGFQGGTVGMKGIALKCFAAPLTITEASVCTESCQFIGGMVATNGRLYSGNTTNIGNGGNPWLADGVASPFSAARYGSGTYLTGVFDGFYFLGSFNYSDISGFVVCDDILNLGDHSNVNFGNGASNGSFDALSAFMINLVMCTFGIAPNGLTPGKIRGGTFNLGVAITAFRNSFVWVQNMDISNVAGMFGGNGTPFFILDSDVAVQDVTGTKNQNGGIEVSNRSVVSLNPGTTITGNPILTVAPAATALTAGISDIATSAPVTSTAGYPASGFILIDAETIYYNSTTPTSFDGLVRIFFMAAPHLAAAPVTYAGIVIVPTDLTAGISDVATSAPVTSTAGFPTSGGITIVGENMHYSSKTPTSFDGLTRGIDGTTAAAHLALDPVTWAYLATDVFMQGFPFGYITYAALATVDNNGVAGRGDIYQNRVGR